jgi:hypothetical protein
VPGPDEGNCFYQISHNTVVKEKSITIYYPHHPYYRKSLPVVEIHRNGNPPGYLCRVSDTVSLFVPKWVTHRGADEGSTIRSSSQVSFENLLKVIDYLEVMDIT